MSLVQYIATAFWLLTFSRLFYLQQQSYASEFSKALGEAILNAEDYLLQKAFGEVTDHEDFFAEDIGTGTKYNCF